MNKICYESIEIEQIIYSVEELRARSTISDRESDPEFLNYSKECIKSQLLNEIGKFIEITTNTQEEYIEGKIFLPYISNSVIKRLERDIKSLTRTMIYLENKIEKLMSRSWWARLWNK